MNRYALSLIPFFLLLASMSQASAFSEAKTASINDGRRMEGWVIDSVTVSGNKKTKDFAILREMELQPGAELNLEILERDRRYLHGLGLFADVGIKADSLYSGGCALRVKVKERSSYFLKTILPVINYDFDKGFSYGLRWHNRNFRGRRETVSASYMRNPDNDESASIGWFAPWMGWRHFELGGSMWLFSRGNTPSSATVLDQWGGTASLGIPLTSSRISFSQIMFRFSVEHRTTGSLESPKENQLFLSPLVGLRLDSRDSYLRPLRGGLFYLALRTWRSISGESQNYYIIWNDLRIFRKMAKNLVFAMQSELTYQFGDFPDYSQVSLGGSGSLRGYPGSEFSGNHVWFQSAEWRTILLPRKVFKLPYLGYIDITLAMVFFVDTGITWDNESAFRLGNFRGGGGFGLRLYSPFQDVLRIDLGLNGHGGAYPYVRTGIRF